MSVRSSCTWRKSLRQQHLRPSRYLPPGRSGATELVNVSDRTLDSFTGVWRGLRVTRGLRCILKNFLNCFTIDFLVSSIDWLEKAPDPPTVRVGWDKRRKEHLSPRSDLASSVTRVGNLRVHRGFCSSSTKSVSECPYTRGQHCKPRSPYGNIPAGRPAQSEHDARRHGTNTGLHALCPGYCTLCVQTGCSFLLKKGANMRGYLSHNGLVGCAPPSHLQYPQEPTQDTPPLKPRLARQEHFNHSEFSEPF